MIIITVGLCMIQGFHVGSYITRGNSSIIQCSLCGTDATESLLLGKLFCQDDKSLKYKSLEMKIENEYDTLCVHKLIIF